MADTVQPPPPNGGASHQISAQSPAPTPLQAAWLAFVKSIRSLLVPQPDDRPLDQYLALRDTVLILVETPEFLKDLQDSSGQMSTYVNYPQILDALLMELKAFPLAVEVAQATEGTAGESPGWLTRFKLLGRASTVTGSVKDLHEHLPWYAKSGLTLLKQVLDLFGAKH